MIIADFTQYQSFINHLPIWKFVLFSSLLQGDYIALLMEEGNCITWKSFLWDLPQGVLKFAINAGLNTLPSADIW